MRMASIRCKHNIDTPRDAPHAIDSDTSFANNVIKKRHRLNAAESAYLGRCFAECPHPNTITRAYIATNLNMPPRSIQIWFQNRRAKKRRDDKAASSGSTLIFSKTAESSAETGDGPKNIAVVESSFDGDDFFVDLVEPDTVHTALAIDNEATVGGITSNASVSSVAMMPIAPASSGLFGKDNDLDWLHANSTLLSEMATAFDDMLPSFGFFAWTEDKDKIVFGD